MAVGDAVEVRDDELFPADLLCLWSALPDKVCFIRTTNLDGETNLKIRKPLDLKGVRLDSEADVMALNITLAAEVPNRNLHKFKGHAQIHNDDYRDMPLSPGSVQKLWTVDPRRPGKEGGGWGAAPGAAAAPGVCQKHKARRPSNPCPAATPLRLLQTSSRASGCR